ACDEAQLHRVEAEAKDDRDGCGRLLRRHCRGQPVGDQQRRRKPDQLGRERRHTLVVSLAEAVFDRNIPADDKTLLLQSLQEPAPQRYVGLRGAVAEISDDRQPRLRGRRERPQRAQGGYASKQVAAHHSISSSARARTASGTARPIALAAATFTT